MSNEHADKAPGHNKEVTVIFNGRPKSIAKERLTFDDVIAYAFDNPPSGDGIQFTMDRPAFRRHPGAIIHGNHRGVYGQQQAVHGRVPQ